MTALPVVTSVLATAGDGSSSTTLGDVISGTWDNLGNNGYQTGISLFVATLIVVALLNAGVNILFVVPTAIGAFWGAWLGWNTVTGEDNPLFPGDLETTKLWEVATDSATSFLLVAVVASVAALFLWRTKLGLPTKILVLVSAVLGASFVYNLYQALVA